VVLGSAILDQDGLDGGEVNRARVVHGSIDIADRKRGAEGTESKGVILGKGRVDNHAFRTTIEKGISTDFLTRLLSNQEDSESDRRRPYISYGFFRYRIRVKSV
jgi:hypothetical protein